MDERRRPYNLFQNEGNISLILYLALLGSICRCRIHETFTSRKEKGFCFSVLCWTLVSSLRCPYERSLTIFALLALALGFDWVVYL